MSGMLAAALLLAAAAVVVGPRPAARVRLAGRRRAPTLPRVRETAARLVTGPPWKVALIAAALAAAAGLLFGGPVGALIAAVYAVLAADEWLRRARRKQSATARAAELDGLCALVADLRAGLPPAAVASVSPVDGGGRVRELVAAVWRLAEQTGAPAADLLDRIEADARAADRAVAGAAAQAAGAQATAFLLAVLPVGGIVLGYVIGADPLNVLLHTPIGAGCAVAAVLLQAGGLRWSQRLVDGPPP
ncbi:tight adherence protein B [Actinoplanes lutulentus]|uniref:Tight adherence protein B n=1 Tax=Actinoplanes lutulentus TaxID=1287878 RepID=A0A327Z7D3_9ACTN|nr:hypothetical protein [Actinoplanes lutulentus]MBB2945076.1 tight adherence protein B [Actinoplanes lutulentus]RAK31872.1 tight adherence protein B [Actinoplanes lutulentus]